MAVKFASETSAAPTVAQVATPRADSERVNWLVHDVPAYSAKSPSAPVRVRAEVRPETTKLLETLILVEVAFVLVLLTPVKF